MSRSVGRRNGCRRSTYGVVLAQVPLVIERLLVHLLHVAVGVAVHFHAIGRGRDAMVRAEDVLRRLREDGRTGLAELRHAIINEVGIHACLGQAMGLRLRVRLLPRCAMSVGLGNLRGKLVVEMVIERVSRTAVLRAAMIEGDVAEVRQVKVVEVVEVNQIAKVLIARRAHVWPRLRISTVHCARRAPAGEVQEVGKWERVSIQEARAISSPSLVGLSSAPGGIASEVETLDALPQESTAVLLARIARRERLEDWGD